MHAFKNIIDKSKWNFKKCSSYPQKSRAQNQNKQKQKLKLKTKTKTKTKKNKQVTKMAG